MLNLNLTQLADIVGGDLARAGDGTRTIDAVTIDSRATTPGALFVPLVGERADGHRFIPAAVEAGAAGYLCRRDVIAELPGGVIVDDPANALLGLAAWVRDEVAPLVVAITGSSGKTTTKDLTAAAVSAGRRVVANTGSFNNELGVPLTCCRLEPTTEVLVAEVGARGVGHVARLSAVLRQDIAVVTTVSAAHLETFGDVDTVARAKAELVEALEPGGTAVLNADNPWVAAMRERAGGEVVTYGLAQDADWQAVDVTFDDVARARFQVLRGGEPGPEVRLAVPGAHNVGNALAALVVADRCGVDVDAAAAALGDARLSSWRMELLATASGATLLNDAYNANPDSTEAALRTLARMGTRGRRWAVLGQMAELGGGSADEHRRVGRLSVELGVDALVVVGEQARPLYDGARDEAAGRADGPEVVAVADADEAGSLLTGRLAKGDVVLVKGSRVAGLERLATVLDAVPAHGGGRAIQ